MRDYSSPIGQPGSVINMTKKEFEAHQREMQPRVYAEVKCSEGAIASHGERALIDTMAITSDRLNEIERKMYQLSSLLFGPEPCDDSGCSATSESSIKSFAGSAFGISVNIERQLDEIYRRLNETH